MLQILLFLGMVSAQLTNSTPIGYYTAPFYVNMTAVGCQYIARFETLYDPTVETVQGSYDASTQIFTLRDIRIFSNIDQNKLWARDPVYALYKYSVNKIQLFAPASNYIETSMDASFPKVREMELQITYQQTDFDAIDINNKRVAVLSIFFSDGASNDANHLPDGVPMILPFTQIPLNGSEVNVDINLNQTFNQVINNFHQWVSFYQGIPPTTTKPNITYVARYFNQQKFYVPTTIMKSFFNATSTAINITTTNYPYKIQPTQLPDLDNTIKLCYGSTGETQLRSNYGVWMWLMFLLIWFLVMICAENDVPTVYKDEFLDNNLTLIPWYSMYSVANDAFFSKLSRYGNWLSTFSFQVLIISILYGQFYSNKKYSINDAVVIWYPIIAIAVAWPISYFFGTIQYHCRQLNKHKMQLEIDLKQISDKHSPKAERIQKAIHDDQDRLYTYWFVHYGILFIFILMNIMVSIWQMTYINHDVSYENYWVASIFIIFFLDHIVLDTLMAFIHPLKCVSKYRGYWYDGELGILYKKAED